MISYYITPVPAPRMTRRDKYAQRPAVKRYFAFRDKCRLKRLKVPTNGAHVTFVIPMPKSWSAKKKAAHLNKPHQTTPDADNLLKALLDAVYADDRSVWDIRVTKIWGVIGQIVIDEQLELCALTSTQCAPGTQGAG